MHESIFDAVVEKLVAGAAQIKLGDPFDDDTQIGPIISAKQLERVTGYVQSGRDEGATIRAGGERLPRPGFFFQPTVVTDATPEMKIVREEIFGRSAASRRSPRSRTRSRRATTRNTGSPPLSGRRILARRRR